MAGKMSQRTASGGKTDYGRAGESGEKFPRGANREDERGERKVRGAGDRDKESASIPKNNKGQTGESVTGRAISSDRSGEKRVGIAGGVGMGEFDDLKGRHKEHIGRHDGRTGEHNTGKQSGDGHFYEHAKEMYRAEPEKYRYEHGRAGKNHDHMDEAEGRE